MKKITFLLFAGFLLAHLQAFTRDNNELDALKAEFSEAVPAEFELDESGEDGVNLYLVFKKSPQEVITVNLQQDNSISFSDTENVKINGHDAVFYYAGFKKSAGLAITLKNNAGHLVIGYNKPYMGDENVKMSELTTIAEKIDLGKFE